MTLSMVYMYSIPVVEYLGIWTGIHIGSFHSSSNNFPFVAEVSKASITVDITIEY